MTLVLALAILIGSTEKFIEKIESESRRFDIIVIKNECLFTSVVVLGKKCEILVCS